MARNQNPGATGADLVIREFPKMGEYRIRLLQSSSGPKLDIREFVSADTFEGFTRRGIRIDMHEAADLAALILDIHSGALKRVAPNSGIDAPSPMMSNVTPLPAPRCQHPTLDPLDGGLWYCEACRASITTAEAFPDAPAPIPAPAVLRDVPRPRPAPPVAPPARPTAAPKRAAPVESPELTALRARMARGEVVSLAELARLLSGGK